MHLRLANIVPHSPGMIPTEFHNTGNPPPKPRRLVTTLVFVISRLVYVYENNIIFLETRSRLITRRSTLMACYMTSILVRN